MADKLLLVCGALPHVVATLALVLALATTSLADFKSSSGQNEKDTAKSAFRSTLKWRSPDGQSTAEESMVDEPAAEEPAPELAQPEPEPEPAAAPSEKPTATSTTTSSSSSGKSVLRLSFRTPVAKQTSSTTESSDTQSAEPAVFSTKEPAPIKPATAAKPLSTASKRSRGYVQRLSDAEPSPHSLGARSLDGNSLSIKKTSNEEPRLDPFGDDAKVAAKPRVNQRAVRVGMQDRSGPPTRNPFGDEPRLDRMPNGQAPERGMGDEVTQAPRSLPYNCPTPKEYVKRLSDISTNIAAEPGEFPAECGLGDEAFVPRNWGGTLYAWKASSLCHKPLYFEDVELERYGQTCSPLLQPILSAAKFYLTLPILPYKMGLEPPCECIYPLGYYRPGSCAPFIIPPVPISLRGALLEAGVWVAGVALVP